jgi:hypothetical protein
MPFYTGKGLSVPERVNLIDEIQGKRLSKLTGVALVYATKGIRQRLKAFDDTLVPPETGAIREIIDFAILEQDVVVAKLELLDDSIAPSYGSAAAMCARLHVESPVTKRRKRRG